MKKVFFIPLIISLINIGCEKEPGENLATSSPTPVFSTPPSVSAGSYIELIFPADSCTLAGIVTTTGSKIKTYLWEKVYGPAAYKIDHSDSLITKVRGLQEGAYIFQLTVTDSNGLTGKATINVNVITVAAFTYNLDLEIQTGYIFYDNAELCPWYCYYSDLTFIEASVQLAPKTNLEVNIYEETDSAVQAYDVGYGYTAFRLTNELFASGPSSFKLKKTIFQSGGTFSDTIHLNSSSALGTWREVAFKAQPPVIVTGQIDTTTLTVNMQIKGKIIF